MNTETKHGLLKPFLVVFSAMMAMTVYAWIQLPETASIAIHWDIYGRPNGYAGKSMALLFGPGMALFLYLVTAVVPSMDNYSENLRKSLKAYRISMIGSILITAVAHALIVLTALHYSVDVSRIVYISLGALFLSFGNSMGKIRSNHWMGYRTSWTLANENCWNKTHRLGGKLFFLSGAFTLVGAVLGLDSVRLFYLFIISVSTAVIVPIIYSYVIFKKDSL